MKLKPQTRQEVSRMTPPNFRDSECCYVCRYMAPVGPQHDVCEDEWMCAKYQILLSGEDVCDDFIRAADAAGATE